MILHESRQFFIPDESIKKKKMDAQNELEESNRRQGEEKRVRAPKA